MAGEDPDTAFSFAGSGKFPMLFDPDSKAMEPMGEALTRHANLPVIRHLENHDGLHQANMNRAITEFGAR